MFEMGNMFNGKFGKIKEGLCRLTMKGGIAVKTASGYKSYNVAKGTLTNVTNFCFDIGSDFFFVIPTSKVQKGDIILVDGHPKCVIETTKTKTIKVIDYESSSVMEIVPERHVFMGNVYFYGKIVSIMGNSMKNGGIGNIMKMMMMSNIMGGNSGSGSGSNGMGNMMQAMMMANMFGGKSDAGDLFEGMFDFEVNEIEDESNEDADEGDE